MLLNVLSSYTAARSVSNASTVVIDRLWGSLPYWVHLRGKSLFLKGSRTLMQDSVRNIPPPPMSFSDGDERRWTITAWDIYFGGPSEQLSPSYRRADCSGLCGSYSTLCCLCVLSSLFAFSDLVILWPYRTSSSTWLPRGGIVHSKLQLQLDELMHSVS